MPDKIVKIDADLTLDQTRDRCVFEQNEGFKLTGIANQTMSQDGEVLNFNEAKFDGLVDFFPQLMFAAPGPTNPEQFKQQKIAQGFTFICGGSIWVQNQ